MVDVVQPFTGSIILAQTAAGPDYEAMLEATQDRHRAYCAANAIEFWSFTGLRRGLYPWQATFNRIAMLADKLREGWTGWFLYLDADAVIRQRDFDIRRYLGKRGHHALIAGPGGEGDWNVNAGVFFLNLEHPNGREIARRWIELVGLTVTDQMLADADMPWKPLPDGRPFPDDQHLLQVVLLRDEGLCSDVLIERGPLLNYRSGRFIRQFIREHGTPAQRLDMMKESLDSAE